MVRFGIGILCALLVTSISTYAQDSEFESAKRRLEQHFPAGVTFDLTPSPVAGLYQLTLSGQVFYISADAEHLVRGPIINLATRENHTENHATSSEWTVNWPWDALKWLGPGERDPPNEFVAPDRARSLPWRNGPLASSPRRRHAQSLLRTAIWHPLAISSRRLARLKLASVWEHYHE